MGSKPAPPETPPETLMASKRKAYHKRYLAEQEYWKENEERLKKEREDKGDQVLQDLTDKDSIIGKLGNRPPRVPHM